MSLVIDTTDFLHSLLSHLADQLDTGYGEGDSRQLFLFSADESLARRPLVAVSPGDEAFGETGPLAYCRVSVYSGPGKFDVGLKRVNVQWAVTGPEVEAMDLAQRLETAMCDEVGEPRKAWVFPALQLADNSPAGQWEIHHVRFINTPGVAGKDDVGRTRVVFNTTLTFRKLST